MNRGALVTFNWRPENSNHKIVQIAGTFTSWQPVDMLPPPAHNANTTTATGSGGPGAQTERGYWTLNRHLEPGEHQYKYVVDGKWMHDEKKDTIENEMGSKNNVIRIEEYPGSEKLSEGLDEEDDRSSVSSIPDDEIEDDDLDHEGWEVLDKPLSQTSSIEVLDNCTNTTNTNGNSLQQSLVNLNGHRTSVCEKPKLEVERKFVVPIDYKDRLAANGFEPVDQFRENLVDAYFDFAVGDFPLLTNDHWLRKRNGDWELKYPVGSSMASSINEESAAAIEAAAAATGLQDDPSPSCRSSVSQQVTTTYHETSNLEDILFKVRLVSRCGIPELDGSRIEEDDDDDEVSLNSLVERSVLRPFAELETKRKCYKRSSDNVNIVVDETDWGYVIGEIEVIVDTKEEVCAATQQIETLASQLEFSKMDLVSLGQQVQRNSAICL